MHLRPLIIFIVVAMVLLLGFNIINSNRHENNRAAAMNINSPADANIHRSPTDINSKPLAEQPKAIIDKATTQIEKAQQVEKDRLAQMDGAK